MVGRILAIQIAAFQFLLCCSLALADTPLVVAELAAERMVAESDAVRATTEMELVELETRVS